MTLNDLGNASDTFKWTDAFGMEHSVTFNNEESITLWTPVKQGTFNWSFGERQESTVVEADWEPEPPTDPEKKRWRGAQLTPNRCGWMKLTLQKQGDAVVNLYCYNYPERSIDDMRELSYGKYFGTG